MPCVKTITLLLALLLLGIGISGAEQVIINFSPGDVKDSPKGKASDYFKRLVEQRSNNRILVRINAEEPTQKPHPLADLESNKVQMAAPEISECYSLNPQLEIFDLPFLFNDIKHIHTVIDGEVGKQLLEKASQSGLVALSFWDNGFRQLTANRPLQRPQQLVGLKFQTIGSSGLGKQLRQLGAEPKEMPRPHLYKALAEKKIDGQESTLATIYSQRLYLVQSSLSISNHSYLGYMVVTNHLFWTQLPDDLKVIIKGAITDAAEYTRDMAAQINQESLKKIRSTASMEIIKLTQEERRIWRKYLLQANPGLYNEINAEIVHKTQQERIR